MKRQESLVRVHTHTHTGNLKDKKAITLIALVITIIVLLILTGITIATLTGENGLFARAKEAKTETEIANIKEEIRTEILTEQAGNTGDITENKLKEILGKYGTLSGEEKLEDNILTTEKGKYKIKVSDIYSGILSEGITCIDIANDTDKSKYYGAEVKGYELPSGTATDVGWKIFYADKNNIYLIADDYIRYDRCPPSTTQTIYKNSDYKLSMNDVIKDYTGSDKITDSKLKALNNDYFTKNYVSTNNNMKSVAYMMDTTAWNSRFKDVNNKAEYVIGGPTIEMLMKSYNEKYNVNYKTKVKDEAGYVISNDGGTNWLTYIEMLDTNDSLYVIKDTTKANAMWVASPSVYTTSDLILVDYVGAVSHYIYSAKFVGFRPLVCLKSDVKLKDNKDGTYTIEETKISNGSYELVNGVYVCTPKLDQGFNIDNTRYLSLGNNGTLEKGKTIENKAPEKWCDYKNKNWANIYVDNNNTETYYVWIPRYCFKLNQDTERSDVKFIDIDNSYKSENGDKTEWTSVGGLKEQGYQVPEAFWWDKNSNGTEDEGEQLPGYWVTKYTIGEQNDILQSNPNIHYKNVDMIANWIIDIRRMEATGGTMGLNETINSDLTASSSSNGIDMHMIKTTERGAMTILAVSEYGNPSNDKEITSTTGNETGIMVDTTKYEWTAGGTANFVSEVNNRYINIYTISNTSAKVGDALGTAITPNPGCAGWHLSDNSVWLNNIDRVFLHGHGSIFSFHETLPNDRCYSRGVVVCGTGI